MTDSEQRFALRAVRRRRLFMVLAVAGVAVAAGLTGLYGWWWSRDSQFPIGPHVVIILLILLNARQNLRQYRYAGVIGELLATDKPGAAPGGAPAGEAPAGAGGGPGVSRRPSA